MDWISLRVFFSPTLKPAVSSGRRSSWLDDIVIGLNDAVLVKCCRCGVFEAVPVYRGVEPFRSWSRRSEKEG